MRQIRLAIALVLIGLLPAGLRAQWKQVTGPNFKPNYQYSGGAIAYGDGVVWAGADDLWKSTDAGRTWTRTIMPVSRIYDISIFDNRTVAVATVDRGVIASTDQGASWRVIHGRGASKVTFGSNAQTLLSCSNSEFVRTTNFGQQWSGLPPLSTGTGFKTVGGVLYHIGDQHLRYSRDNGANWTTTPGLFDRDSYDFGVDSCNPQTMVVVNEELYLPDDNVPALYRSTNAGGVWTASTPFRDYCGNIASSRLQMFVQTMHDGVIASSDGGVTWKLAGGPSGLPDQTMICVIEDSVLIVADEDGVLWRTAITPGNPFATPTTLFAGDSSSMCDALTATAAVFTACSPYSSARIIGSDSHAYAIDTTIERYRRDSIVVRFTPTAPRTLHAELQVYLTNGDTIRIALSGTGKATEIASLSGASLTARAIGEEIDVPVHVSNAASTQSVGFVIDYDPTVLQFVNALKLDGSIASSTEAPLGHVVVALPTADLASQIAGHLTFRWFPTSTANASITIDSLTAIPLPGHCLYASDTSATVTIDGVDDCSNATLSQYLRYGANAIMLRPNPASTAVTLSGVLPNLNGRLVLIDVSGRVRMSATVESDAIGRAVVPIDRVPDGVYALEFVSDTMLPFRATIVVKH